MRQIRRPTPEESVRSPLIPRASLLGLVSLSLALGLFVHTSAITKTPENEPTLEAAAPTPTPYQEMARKYFFDRSMEFAYELLLKEEYLRELYECTVKECQTRRVEGFNGDLLNNPLWEVSTTAPDLGDSATLNAAIGERYKLWKAYEEIEFQRRYGLVQQVRAQLINTGTEEQNQRMFQRELKKALIYYGNKDWELARLLFDRILEDYPYQEVDDILYYQAQTCLQMGLLNQALDAFEQVLTAHPQSEYRAKSYDMASAILEAFGDGYQIRRLYSRYVEENYPGDQIAMGGIFVRAARAEMKVGHYELAVEILAHVSRANLYYLASQYLLADCYTAMEDWPQAVKVLTAMAEIKPHEAKAAQSTILKDEARLKLAFIYYQWRDFEHAAQIFDQTKSNSPFYDRVLMGKAWLAFELEDYEKAIGKTEEMLKLYPLSTEIYEANALAGYCSEQLGKETEAIAHFLAVLDAGAGRADLQSFLEERRRIAESMANLQSVEEEVFVSGDEKLFSDYRRARNQLWICQQRIGLAELLQVNGRMRALVEERIALDSLIIEHTNLEQQVAQRRNQNLIAQFLAIDDRIWTSMEHLKRLGQEQAKSTPLFYKEAQVGYINSRADSLARRLEIEIEQLSAATRSVEELQRTALAENNIDEYLKLSLRLDRLDQTLDRTNIDQALAENSKRAVLRTRVDRWSDFSFNRYAMGGMNLEQLDRKYERLRQVDEFITALDEIIAQKQKDAVIPPVEGQQ